MNNKKRILLKLTGEVFMGTDNNLCPFYIRNIITQIKELQATHLFAIAIGGGNFFRGSKQGAQLGLTAAAGHQTGMLATMLNAVIVKDFFEQNQVTATILSAIDCPAIGNPVSLHNITSALAQNHVIIFAGGTGNPFFTTDTNAILRALQINAHETWKGTKVNGIYNKDPQKYVDAYFYSHISYQQAIEQNLKIMDATALTLAQEHNQIIRVFNIFQKDALINAAQESNFGGRLSN